MLDWIKSSADWLAVTVGGIVAAALVLRWLAKRVRRSWVKWDNAREALVGREAILHPDTGRVLVEATPGLGQRLSSIEEGQRLIGQTLSTLGETQAETAELNRRVGELTDQLGNHITESNKLEMERTKEREAMWDAIRAVATPTPWDGTERRQIEGGK